MKVYVVMEGHWYDGFETDAYHETISSIADSKELAEKKVESLIQEAFNRFIEEDPDEKERVGEKPFPDGHRAVHSSDGHEEFYAWFDEWDVEEEIKL